MNTIFNTPIYQRDNRFSSNISLHVLGSTITSDYINEASYLPGKFLRIEYVLPINFITLLDEMRIRSRTNDLEGILSIRNLKGESTFKMINLTVEEPFVSTNGVIKLLGYINLNVYPSFPASELVTTGSIHNWE